MLLNNMLSSAFKYFGNLFGSPSYSQQDLENELDKLNSKKDEEHDEYQVGIREAKKNYKKIIGEILYLTIHLTYPH